MPFTDFELDPRCLRVLKTQRIEEPTPIQAQAIPAVLEGRDLVGVAQTGTGKTLGFALPCLTRLAAGKPERNSMLVLVPTRELAVQVHKVITAFGKALGVTSAVIYGGVGLPAQAQELKRGVTVIVATPGRLLDHMSRGNIRFTHLSVLVLDEADRMLDMGFLPDIQRIVRKLPTNRQTLMFSATFPDEIARLASTMLNNPERVTVGAISKPVDTVQQVLYPVSPENKTQLLINILDEADVASALVFLRTKDRTERLAHALHRKGLKVTRIHGDRSQSQRQQALDGFRQGRYTILVATDVAARGLDIEGISHVFNFDIPPTADDYIHRIGRTARAQAQGNAITFVSPAEYQPLENIEKALGHVLPRVEVAGAPAGLVHVPPSIRGRSWPPCRRDPHAKPPREPSA